MKYSITKRGDSPYLYAQFTNPETGRNTFRSLKTKNRREAYQKAEELMEAIYSGRPEAHAAVTTYLQDHLSEYLTYLSDKGSAPKYVRQCGNQVRKLLECAKISEVRHLINQGPIQICVSKLPAQGLSPTTVNSYVRAFKSFTKYLYKMGHTPAHYCSALEGVKQVVSRERGPFTKQELKLLLKTIPEVGRNYRKLDPITRCFLYQTAFSTGLRAGELQELKVEDVAQDGSFIRIRASVAKNAKAVTQPVSERAAAFLKNLIKGRKPDDNVFPKVGQRHGEMLKKDMEDAGIPVHDSEGRYRDFHSFRVTYVTELLQAGLDVKSVQTLARHSNPVLTLNAYAKTVGKEELRNKLSITDI